MERKTNHKAAEVASDMFAVGGEMGALMRATDWAATPIGPVAAWPQSLRTITSVCLTSRFPMLIWWGPELVMLYNDAYRPILGTTKHPRSMGQPGKSCFPEIWDIIGPMLASVLQTGQATWSNDQLLLLDRSGYIEECYFTFSYSPIFAESGEVGGVFTAVTETTERVVGERRLLMLRELGESSMQALTIAATCTNAVAALAQNPLDIPFTLLYLLDADGVTLRLAGSAGIEPDLPSSPRHLTITEASPWPFAAALSTGEMQVATHITDLLAGSDFGTALPHTAVILPVAQAGQTQPHGFLVAGVNPHRMPDAEHQGFLALVARQMATALASARAMEEEKRRAEALAELDRAKTTFFSNVSHEFRTPLTLMLGPVEDSLQDTVQPLTASQRERQELVLRNGQRLLQLVNTLLDFARIEAGRVQAQYAPTDLAALTADLASTFRSLVEKAGLQLSIECDPLPEPVYVDRDMWEKIVLNLLSNAFKFTFAGTISVMLQPHDGQVELTVRDTGGGIPAVELPRLFERFHRVEGARGRSYEGTGIGLALVQELVHMHGGVISVTSQVGAGTTFSVTLPLGTAHLAPDRIVAVNDLTAPVLDAMPFVAEAARWLPGTPLIAAGFDPATIIPAAPVEGIRLGRTTTTARILVVDDNPDMRTYLGRLLATSYAVEVVADGATALASASVNPPDLIVSDVMMPELDGMELLQALRADLRTQNIPVILLSARAGEEATLEGLSAGADDYLVKPFSARELLARIAARLELAQARAETSSLLATMTDAFFAIDHDWICTYCNDAAEKILLRPADEVIGRYIWDLYPEAIDSDFWRAYHRAMDEHIQVTFEAFFEPLQIWLEERVYPTPTGISIYVRDITVRKRMAEEIQTRAQQLTTVIQAMTDAVYIYDAEGKLTHANLAAQQASALTSAPDAKELSIDARVKRYPLRDAQGEILARDQWPVVRLLRGERLRGDAPTEVWQSTPDGRACIMSFTGAPLCDSEGGIIGCLLVGRDVTEQRQLEQRTQAALQSLVATAETLVQVPEITTNHAADTIHTIGDRLTVLISSSLSCQMVCIAATDVHTGRMQPVSAIGLTLEANRQWWDDIAHTPLHEYFTPEQYAGILAGEVITCDITQESLLNGDATRQRQALVVPMRLGETVVGLLFVECRSYSSEDWALLQAMGRLCALVLERDRLLRDREIAHAQTLALSQANAQMDAFLGIASHELRTPLTTITANVQLAERQVQMLRDAQPGDQVMITGPKLERLHTLLQRTDRQSQRLDRLVGDLLDISRIDAGKLELRMEQINLVTLLRDAVAGQRAAWPDRSLTIDMQRITSLQLAADPDRIAQVITNFLTNALKYSAEDQPVAVHLHVQHGLARVEVSDHGPGLTPEQQERLWERFYRVPGIELQSGSGVGLGLGLYICQTIIDRHGGQVGVVSTPGIGSTFWFSLPLSPA